MSKLKIIYKPIDEIIPYKNNPRKNESGVDAVAKSIETFGFKVPIIIDGNNEIVAGHTRILAAKKLGITEIPCVIADDLDDMQIKALRIADNRTSEFSTWDFETLAIELQELQSMDFDIEITGFDDDALNSMMSQNDPLDLSDDANDGAQTKKTCFCPKCGFEFEV